MNDPPIPDAPRLPPWVLGRRHEGHSWEERTEALARYARQQAQGWLLRVAELNLRVAELKVEEKRLRDALARGQAGREEEA